MSLLAEHFLSSWFLVVDLKAVENDENQPEMAKLAKYHLSLYEFPVMMSVSLPNGTIVHTVNANNFLDTEKDVSIFESGFEDPAGVAYAKFLQDGLKKAKAIMEIAT